MKTTINQIKTFYNNHPLKDALERAEKLYSDFYDFDKDLDQYSKLELRARYERMNSLKFRLSKDIHNRFKDLERYLNTNSLYHKFNFKQVEIFNKYKPYYSLQIGLNGSTYLKISNPLDNNADIIIKNHIKNINEVPKIVKQEFKKLFFGNGHGVYAEMQIENNLSKSELLKQIELNKSYKLSEYYDHEQDEFCKHATLKALKRNLNLVFNEHMSTSFIIDAVNQIGQRNKGKTAKKVFSFDATNINTSEDIDTLENSFYNEYYKQSKKAILI